MNSGSSAFSWKISITAVSSLSLGKSRNIHGPVVKCQRNFRHFMKSASLWPTACEFKLRFKDFLISQHSRIQWQI